MSTTTYLEKELGLALVHIPAGSKGPVHKNWQKSPTPAAAWENGLAGYNVGVLHHQSRTVCYDIDDVKTVRRKYPALKKLIDASSGLRWTSGVKNRLKILFKVDKKLWKKMRVLTIPGGCGQIRGGKNCGLQDVIAGVHPTGSHYRFLNESEVSYSSLQMPKWVQKELLATLRSQSQARNNSSVGAGVGAGSGYAFIDVYNKWFMDKGKDLEEEIFALGGYDRVGMGGRLRRKGSNNVQSVVIYNDSDGIDRAYNFSDTTAVSSLLPKVGTFDPYGVLSVRMGFDEARRWVCQENAELSLLVDSVKEVVKKNSGILFQKKDNMPYLSLDTMVPPNSNMGMLVKSIMKNQIQVYNPNVAFWYSLVLVDYLAGGGYGSFNTPTTMSPLYCFTSGSTSDGKSKTIDAGEAHIFAIGGSGSAPGVTSPLVQEGNDSDPGSVSVPFTTYFNCKYQFEESASMQGLQDKISKHLGHGCDLLYTHDEFGITSKASGGSSGVGRAAEVRGFIMSIKSMSRLRPYRYRLKVISKDNKPGPDTFCVHFNYFTSTTNEALKGVLGDGDMGTGFVQRFIGGPSITEYNSSRVEMFGSMSPSRIYVSKKLKKVLKAIVRISGSVAGLERMTNGVFIEMEDGVQELINAKSISISSLSKAGRVDGLKVLENILPVARARAIIECPSAPVVTVEYFNWACTVVESSVVYFSWLLGTLRSKDVNVPLRIEQVLLGWLDRTIQRAVKGGTVVEGKNACDATSKVIRAGDTGCIPGQQAGKRRDVGLPAGTLCWFGTRRELVTGSGIGKFGAAAYNPVVDSLVYAEVLELENVVRSSGRSSTKIWYFQKS